MKLQSCILASLLMLSASPLFADVAISYGEGAGKAEVINSKKYPKLEDPLPFGPLAFRMVDNNVFVTDSVGGKVMQFSKDGKFISEFSVLEEGKKPYVIEYETPTLNVLIEDIAPVRGDYGVVTALWVADSQYNRLLKFSVDGKKLAEITNPEFAQLYRVEVGAAGHIFVADKGARAIFTYDAEGKLVNKSSWEWTGMAVAGADEKLYRLIYDNEAQKHNLVATGLDGKVISAKALEVINMFNAKLWWVDEDKNECVITYSPETGFKGTYHIVRVNIVSGAVIASGELKAPFVMNRFMDNLDYSEVFVGKADYETAPEGKLEIVPLAMPVAASDTK